MIKYSYLLLALLILTLKSLHAQKPAKETLWSEQDPWEGVPEYYQKWNYPNFQFPHSLSAWQNERVKVRDTLLQLLGNIPGRPQQLNVKTVYKKKMNGYMLEKFIIDNGIDSWIPGYLAIPLNVQGKVPVIVGLHGHGSSKDNVFGINSNTAQDVLALLIAKGYAVMAIDSYFNGERRGQGPAGSSEMQEKGSDQETSLFKINLWFGRSLWGMQLRDEQIALDYLMRRPEIDSSKIGVEGMSMGSTRAWWLAAIDSRIKVVAGIACFTRYQELISQRELEAHGIYYFVPGMLEHFDTEAVMGLIAPRPFLVLTGDSDPGSPISGMKTLERKLNAVYSLYTKNENFKSIIYPNTGHVYTDDMKNEMVDWFDKYLR
ncbi:MAG: alpha/beta hydrolase family protein [Ginsengibacter sp.]